MSEDTYAKIDFTKKVRFQTEKDTDAARTDSVIIYDNCWVGSTPPQLQDTTEDQQKTILVNAPSAKRDLIRPAVVLLVLLYLLLMGLVIVVTVLWIQDRSLNINLTSERDQLQTSYRDIKSLNVNLTSERDQLQTSYSDIKSLNVNLTSERDQLQTSYSEVKNLTIQLQNNISVVTKERDDLKRQRGTCPPDWLKLESSCYLITYLWKNWHDSKQYCEEKGAHLPIISSMEEQVFLSLCESSWIGLTDEEEEGVWRWVDGTKANKTYWRPGQPDNARRKEHCAHISRNYGLQNWNDVQCDNTELVICQNNTVPPFN